jgi:NADH-quinone oxidoreductase subunit J
MQGGVVAFWLLATLIVVSATVAAFARSVVNAAYALFVSLLTTAGIYALLDADFLAVTQVVIYVGGILVLLLFGILLTNRSLEDLISSSRRPFWVGTAIAAGVFAILLTILTSAYWPVRPLLAQVPTTAPLGVLLLQKYVVAFEFSSLTLLAALIGASYLVRRKERD